MSENFNTNLVCDWVEQVWNRSNFELLAEFHPFEFENEGRKSNIEQAREWHQGMRTTYPDLSYVIEDIVATGDRVMFRWTATGTHRGKLWGFINPTGNRITWNGMHMLKISDERIVEVWAVSNTMTQLQQMGVQLKQSS